MALIVGQITGTGTDRGIFIDDGYEARLTKGTVETDQGYFDTCLKFKRGQERAQDNFFLKVKASPPSERVSCVPMLMRQQDIYTSWVLTQNLRGFDLPHTNQEYYYFEFIFKPQSEDYDQLIFKLNINHMRTPEALDINLSGTQLLRLNNLIPNNLEIQKIGIQGPPGLLTCINGEGIRVGPSGILEISKVGNFRFDFVGIMPNPGDSYIIDYQGQTK